MHLVEGTTADTPSLTTKNNGIPHRRDERHIQGLVADLCLTLTARSPGTRLGSDRIPLKQLKQRAYAALLRQNTSSSVSVLPKPDGVSSYLRTWSVEEVLLAKAFEWHLSGRKRGADRLRHCLSQLHLGTEGVRAVLHFLLLLSEDTAKCADGSAWPFTRRQTSPDPYRQAAFRGDVPWFTEYSSELFEGTQREISSYDDIFAFPGLFEAVPGFDSNGNPLFTLSNRAKARSDSLPSWGSQVLCPPKVASLNKLSRIQMTQRFGLPSSKTKQPRPSPSASSGEPRQLPQVGDGSGGERPTAEASRNRELPVLLPRGSESRVARDKLSLHPLTVKTRVLLQHILYLLGGIPSESFVWDQARRRFIARRGLCMEGISEQALHNVLAGCLRCGTEVHCLEEWSTRTDSETDGLILQAFCCGLRRYLHSYQGSLLCITHNLEDVTLLRLDHLTTNVREQVVLTARFCREELKASHRGIGVRGTDLLGRLYRAAVNSWCQDHYEVLLLLLHYTSQPYCRFLQDWLFNGYYNDPFEEFPVTLDSRLTGLHDETFWLRGFELRKSPEGTVPLPFLSHLTDEVLLCAKTVTFLMLCLPHKVELWDGDHPPPLALTFSRESSHRIREAAERYFDTKRKSLGFELWVKDQQTAAPLENSQGQGNSKTCAFSTTGMHAAAQGQRPSSRQSSDASSRDEEPKKSAPLTTEPEQTAEAAVAHPLGAVSSKHAPLDEVGLYCEASQTYGAAHPRNPHGHSSDSQMKNILYPELELEGSSSAEKHKDHRTTKTKCCLEECIDVETGENVSSLEHARSVTNSKDFQKVPRSRNPADNLSSAKGLEDIGQPGGGEDLKLCNCLEGDSASQKRDNAESPTTQENKHTVKADHVDSASSDDAEKERLMSQSVAGVSAANREKEQRTEIQDTVLQGNKMRTEQMNNGDFWLQHLKCRVEPLTPIGSLKKLDVSWKEYLISAYCARLPNSRDNEQLLPLPPGKIQELGGRGSSMPLQHAVEGSLLPPLLAQMRLVNGVAVAYFMRDLDLSSHLEALGDFFCLQDGDFAQTLCSAICEKAFASRAPSDLLHRSTLCQILSQALASSLRRDSPQAARLSLDARNIPESFPSGENMVSYLVLNYRVEWPLNLVITASSLQRYNKLFHFLLQIHRAQWALTDVWFRIRPTATRGCPQTQLKRLQLIRHEMEYFVQLLQSSVGSQAVLATLQELQDHLSNKIHNLEDLRQAHATCITHLARRCLLVKRAAPVAKILHRALRSIQHFRLCVLRQPWVSAARSGESSAFGEVLAAHAVFRDETTVLCQALKVWGKSASLTWCTRLSMALASSLTKRLNHSAHWNHPAVCRTALSK